MLIITDESTTETSYRKNNIVDMCKRGYSNRKLLVWEQPVSQKPSSFSMYTNLTRNKAMKADQASDTSWHPKYHYPNKIQFSAKICMDKLNAKTISKNGSCYNLNPKKANRVKQKYRHSLLISITCWQNFQPFSSIILSDIMAFLIAKQFFIAHTKALHILFSHFNQSYFLI